MSNEENNKMFTLTRKGNLSVIYSSEKETEKENGTFLSVLDLYP